MCSKYICTCYVIRIRFKPQFFFGQKNHFDSQYSDPITKHFDQTAILVERIIRLTTQQQSSEFQLKHREESNGLFQSSSHEHQTKLNEQMIRMTWETKRIETQNCNYTTKLNIWNDDIVVNRKYRCNRSLLAFFFWINQQRAIALNQVKNAWKKSKLTWTIVALFQSSFIQFQLSGMKNFGLNRNVMQKAIEHGTQCAQRKKSNNNFQKFTGNSIIIARTFPPFIKSFGT